MNFHTTLAFHQPNSFPHVMSYFLYIYIVYTFIVYLDTSPISTSRKMLPIEVILYVFKRTTMVFILCLNVNLCDVLLRLWINIFPVHKMISEPYMGHKSYDYFWVGAQRVNSTSTSYKWTKSDELLQNDSLYWYHGEPTLSSTDAKVLMRVGKQLDDDSGLVDTFETDVERPLCEATYDPIAVLGKP